MTQSGTPQLHALTGLRGIAAWLVVIYHYREALAPLVPRAALTVAAQGALAVDLFFVLSGFIIALNYRKVFQADGMRAYGRFLLLRMARIYPLHIVMLAVFVLYIALVSLVRGRDELHSVGYLIESIFLVQAWVPGTEPALNVPAWSISTEMFACLLFPAMALVAERARAWTAFGVLGAALLALMMAAPAFGGLRGDIAHFGLARCVLEFTAGVMVQRLWELGSHRPWLGMVALAAGVALALCLAAGAPDSLVMPAAFCCAIYGLAAPGTPLRRLLTGRALMLLGRISYATYLSHEFVKICVKFLLARPDVPAWVLLPAYVAAVLLISWLLYEFVELPGRRLLRGFADRAAALPAFGAAPDPGPRRQATGEGGPEPASAR